MEYVLIIVGAAFALGVMIRNHFTGTPGPGEVPMGIGMEDTEPYSTPPQAPTPDTAIPTDPIQEHFNETRPDPARSTARERAIHALDRADATIRGLDYPGSSDSGD